MSIHLKLIAKPSPKGKIKPTRGKVSVRGKMTRGS